MSGGNTAHFGFHSLRGFRSLHSFYSFDHGVHPQESKEEPKDFAIRQFPFAPVMNIPLTQHIGKPAVPVVREGQEMLCGQLVAEPDGFISAATHSPASELRQRTGLIPSIAGAGNYLKPFPGATQAISWSTPCELVRATSDEIITAIQCAGIGGAAFPFHVKLKASEGTYIDILIINDAECGPYLTTDHRVMLEQQQDILIGIRYLLKVIGAECDIIGIEANKQDVAESIRAALPADVLISNEVLKVKYPQGAGKILITALLGREVPSGRLPLDVHVVVVNVATAAEIVRLLPPRQGIQERVITISGSAIKKRGNYRIPIGTPPRFALDYVSVDEDLSQGFLGGPMMGTALSSLDTLITKGTSGFVAFTEQETGSTRHEYACIRCACSYVCPSHIPLVQYFRAAKMMARNRQGSS